MYSRGKTILQAALSNLQNIENNNPPNHNSCISKSLGQNIFYTVQDLQSCEGGVVNQDAVPDTDINLDCISSITTDEIPLVSEYENNETDLEGTPDMTNKGMEVLEDLSVVNVNMKVQLYLEKGHTMIECDSVHTTLEKYFIPPINASSDYIAQMRNVRPKQPYHIKVKAGELVVTDIRALEYRNNGDILFKLRHTGAFQFLPQRKQRSTGHVVPELLYSRPIPIAESKRKCLRELKNVIAKDHHTFYDNLPFQKDNNTTKGKQS
ncbi:hypothetical protein ILUMI_23561 [Ignelater luminosus]|uniref:Uncharacterized protein n=1 Tax=Ignelater luminosus TaxID=2038154 RepID=A0A8K0FWV8_IGNLU|nr:hypothetical protein ILUMI_23561 [Ignelater luminosus]